MSNLSVLGGNSFLHRLLPDNFRPLKFKPQRSYVLSKASQLRSSLRDSLLDCFFTPRLQTVNLIPQSSGGTLELRQFFTCRCRSLLNGIFALNVFTLQFFAQLSYVDFENTSFIFALYVSLLNG